MVSEGETGVCMDGVIAVVWLLVVALEGGMRLMKSSVTVSGNCRVMFLLFVLPAVEYLSLHLGVG